MHERMHAYTHAACTHLQLSETYATTCACRSPISPGDGLVAPCRAEQTPATQKPTLERCLERPHCFRRALDGSVDASLRIARLRGFRGCAHGPSLSGRLVLPVLARLQYPHVGRARCPASRSPCARAAPSSPSPHPSGEVRGSPRLSAALRAFAPRRARVRLTPFLPQLRSVSFCRCCGATFSRRSFLSPAFAIRTRDRPHMQQTAGRECALKAFPLSSISRHLLPHPCKRASVLLCVRARAAPSAGFCGLRTSSRTAAHVRVRARVRARARVCLIARPRARTLLASPLPRAGVSGAQVYSVPPCVGLPVAWLSAPPEATARPVMTLNGLATNSPPPSEPPSAFEPDASARKGQPLPRFRPGQKALDPGGFSVSGTGTSARLLWTQGSHSEVRFPDFEITPRLSHRKRCSGKRFRHPRTWTLLSCVTMSCASSHKRYELMLTLTR